MRRLPKPLALALFAALAFDLDGDGRFTVEGKDGLLVFDPAKSGLYQVFNAASDLDGDGRPDGFADGFEVLGALARRAVAAGKMPPLALEDGRLDAGELGCLEKGYGLRLRLFGRAAPVSLREAGVRAIVLSRGPGRRVRGLGEASDGTLQRPGALFIRQDGSADAYAEVRPPR